VANLVEGIGEPDLWRHRFHPSTEGAIRLRQVSPMTTRRSFLQSGSLSTAGLCSPSFASSEGPSSLREFSYTDSISRRGPPKSRLNGRSPSCVIK
jgi:hypothetical protein